jgi:predicted tellurium resistance membrane protein TerC
VAVFYQRGRQKMSQEMAAAVETTPAVQYTAAAAAVVMLVVAYTVVAGVVLGIHLWRREVFQFLGGVAASVQSGQTYDKQVMVHYRAAAEAVAVNHRVYPLFTTGGAPVLPVSSV